MPLFEIKDGVVSAAGVVYKPGMIVDWTEEQAAAWYPDHKGWIVPVEQPKPAEVIEQHATKEPEMVPAQNPEPPRQPEERSEKVNREKRRR